MSFTSRSTIRSDRASSYLQPLCKHFGHSLDVEFTSDRDLISFDFGRCDLVAESDTLTMAAMAEDEEALERVERVMGSHLSRFAFRENLEITWATDAV